MVEVEPICTRFASTGDARLVLRAFADGRVSVAWMHPRPDVCGLGSKPRLRLRQRVIQKFLADLTASGFRVKRPIIIGD